MATRGRTLFLAAAATIPLLAASAALGQDGGERFIPEEARFGGCHGVAPAHPLADFLLCTLLGAPVAVALLLAWNAIRRESPDPPIAGRHAPDRRRPPDPPGPETIGV